MPQSTGIAKSLYIVYPSLWGSFLLILLILKVTWFTSRGKLATQMGKNHMAFPKPNVPYYDYGVQYILATEPSFCEDMKTYEKWGLCQPIQPGKIGAIHSRLGIEKEGKDNTTFEYKSFDFSNIKVGEVWSSQRQQAYVANGGFGYFRPSLIEKTASELKHMGVEWVPGFPNQNAKIININRRKDGKWNLKAKDGTIFGPYDVVIGGFSQHCLTDPFLLSGKKDAQPMLECLRRVEFNQLVVMQVEFPRSVRASFTMAFINPIIPSSTSASFEDIITSYLTTRRNLIKMESLLRLVDITVDVNVGKHIKPYRAQDPELWTLVSTAHFAETQFHTNPKGYRKIAEKHMLADFAKILGKRVEDLGRYKINRINHWEDAVPVTVPTPPTKSSRQQSRNSNMKGCTGNNNGMVAHRDLHNDSLLHHGCYDLACGYLFDTNAMLAWCGDFCVAPSVEGAALSGRKAANAVVKELSSKARTMMSGEYQNEYVEYNVYGDIYDDKISSIKSLDSETFSPTSSPAASVAAPCRLPSNKSLWPTYQSICSSSFPLSASSSTPTSTAAEVVTTIAHTDIGSFPLKCCGLMDHFTHTNLVPSAVGGYKKKIAKYGAGRQMGRVQESSRGSARNTYSRNRSKSRGLGRGGGGRS
eukprot:jgi/Bigna1/89943/estExt_fgenesh1_pg.C_580116